MKVLVVGSGGREHALAWKLSASKGVKSLFIAPGNAGTASVGKNVELAADDVDGLLRFAKRESIDLTVVGPELPLVAGIVDRFSAEGLRIFGPSKRAARLEGSKVFAKDIMRRHGIPSAGYSMFDDPRRAADYVREIGTPIVVKAEGLAAGKGVVVCSTEEEALSAIDEIMVKKAHGSAGERVVIEECLTGEEASVLALTDGSAIAPLASAQDHKRVGDGDTGPNTGGMGAYSPAPVVTKEVMDRVISEILVPTVHAMKKEGCPFRGVLYAGVMIQDGAPKVLEFNVRFGDPETQPILMRLKSDLAEVLAAVCDGKLSDCDLDWDDRAAVCVVVASGGYPGSYKKGKVIGGLDEAALVPGVTVFHAGTELKGGKAVTSGGRVLGVTALGKDVREARDAAYAAAAKVRFEGAFYRKDIGAKALR